MVIAAIIPTFNRKKYLNTLLAQLKNQFKEDNIIEIVIVVDGSTDGTLEMLEVEFPEVHIVKGDGNWWYTKSMNEGFKYAERLKADYVLTLNDDIEVEEDYIQQLINATLIVPENSIIGSLTLTIKKPRKIIGAGIKKIIKWKGSLVPYYKFLEPLGDKQLVGIYTSVVLPGRGMLIPCNILNKLNYFDESFKQYASDYDFCLRAQNKGYKVFISCNAKVYSHINMSSESSSFIKKPLYKFIKGFVNPYSRIYLPSRAKYIWRHGIKILWPISFLIFILASIKANFINPKLNSL